MFFVVCSLWSRIPSVRCVCRLYMYRSFHTAAGSMFKISFLSSPLFLPAMLFPLPGAGRCRFRLCEQVFLKEEGQDMLRGCMRSVYHRKAALIQACVRAMQGSAKLKEKKAAAIVIHSAARMFLLRSRFRSMVSKVCTRSRAVRRVWYGLVGRGACRVLSGWSRPAFFYPQRLVFTLEAASQARDRGVEQESVV